jgi:hypothetical protein
MTRSTNSLVSEEDQNALMSWGHSLSESGWLVGFMAVAYVDNRPEGVSKTRMRAAVAQYVGCAPGTIRSDFEHVARAVPRVLIREWETLTRNHFRALIPFCKTAEEFNKTIAAWQEQSETQSVASLRAWLHQQNGQPDAWRARLHRARGLCEDIAEDDRAPDALRDLSSGYASATESFDSQ